MTAVMAVEPIPTLQDLSITKSKIGHLPLTDLCAMPGSARVSSPIWAADLPWLPAGGTQRG